MAQVVYQFGEFVIDPAARELWRDGRLVALPPTVFDCLTYLLERHDRAVGRDELVAAVWGKTDVSDTLLGQTILRIRRELGDDAREQRIVRTIPRFGYRWVAPLDSDSARGAAITASENASPLPVVVAATEPSPDPDPASTVAVAAPRRTRRLALVIALAVVVLGGTVAWFFRARDVTPAAGWNAGPVSAVLPASVESDSEWSWMRLGVMDAVASHLRTSGVPSVPSENVVALLAAPDANRGGDMRATLAADLLVTPRVHRVADSWLVGLDADDAAGRHYTVEAQAHDAMAAARAAADKLLAALGRKPGNAHGDNAESALVQRVDAAVLADDPDTARALIANASAEERRTPELRLRLAKIDYRGGRYDTAHERLVALLDEAPATTAPVLRASILNGIGAVAIRSDHAADAERAFAEAIGLLEAHPDPEQLGQAWIGRAAAAAEQRRFEDAAAGYARARVALRQANDTLGLVRVAANEGFLDYDQGRPHQALQQLAVATEGFRRWGALNEAILSSIGQIDAQLALLDARAALQIADAAAPLAERIDNKSTLASLALAHGRALLAVGRNREARGVFDELRRMSDDPILATVAGNELARLELETGNASAAFELAERGVQLLTTPDYAIPRANAWLTQVRAALRGSDPNGAANMSAAFTTWAGQSGVPRAGLFATLAAAETVHAAGAPDWRAGFEAARDLAARNGVPYEIAAVARSHADALLADGDLDAAVVEVGRVTRWSEQDFGCAVLEARLYAALGRNEARQEALARARALAGERSIPADALSVPVSTRAASN
jgi:DNA-binding winged helix-turn-helix (wHTH) protein/tetratricopeptide (TPR) repeat protein